MGLALLHAVRLVCTSIAILGLDPAKESASADHYIYKITISRLYRVFITEVEVECGSSDSQSCALSTNISFS